MPRSPRIAPAVDAIAGAIFSPLAHRIAHATGEIFPLHVGDTWMEPCAGARMEDLSTDVHPGMHRYTDTQGHPALIDALVEKVRARNGIAAERSSILVTAGATGALAPAIGMLSEPGEEVLILSPFWPLIRGIVQSARVRPVEVPFFDRVATAGEAVAAVRARTTARTVALYVSSPSNPTGRVLPAEWLEAIADFARREDLWLLSDEVYEDYVYRGEHVSPARFAPERTLSVFSFSKAYGMAGNRVGYLVGPAAAIAAARKVSTHSVYHPPTAGQLAALRALEQGAAWIENAREAYRRAGDDAAVQLGLASPCGGTFLFLDVKPLLDERGLWGFLEDCLDDGVLLAPGASCGEDYPTWVRLCFSAAPPAQMAEAVRRLARRVGRESR
ncbi:MAG: pyridoxal phosphate-dependent aminotransferase [Deltaproteobacteria bacterium]|nr:pyridoxal phosphate-dependent aminotransferase [Deltaproteobacteria bacterium]